MCLSFACFLFSLPMYSFISPLSLECNFVFSGLKNAGWAPSVSDWIGHCLRLEPFWSSRSVLAHTTSQFWHAFLVRRLRTHHHQISMSNTIVISMTTSQVSIIVFLKND